MWSMCSQPRLLESDFRSILFLWRVSTDYVTYCERLSRYEIPRWSVSLASGWGGGYRLARHAVHRAHAKKKKKLPLNDAANHYTMQNSSEQWPTVTRPTWKMNSFGFPARLAQSLIGFSKLSMLMILSVPYKTPLSSPWVSTATAKQSRSRWLSLEATTTSTIM